MIRYQGEDIPFNIKLNTLKTNDVTRWFDFGYVYIYFYTQTTYISDFGCKLDIDDNGDGVVLDNKLKSNELDYINDNVINGNIPTRDTKRMCGAMYMDILVRYRNGTIDTIKRVNTGINIVSTPIKLEAAE